MLECVYECVYVCVYQSCEVSGRVAVIPPCAVDDGRRAEGTNVDAE